MPRGRKPKTIREEFEQMVKTEAESVAPQPEPRAAPPKDETPQQSFEAAWTKDQSIREVLTKQHEIRGGLRPSQIERAKDILRQYGLN